VDGVEVAKDNVQLPGLASSDGSLYIGTWTSYTLDTSFSGLIDDVHIYNRAVRP